MCCITHEKCSTHQELAWRHEMRVPGRANFTTRKCENRRDRKKFNEKEGKQEIATEQTAGVWAQENDARKRMMPSFAELCPPGTINDHSRIG